MAVSNQTVEIRTWQRAGFAGPAFSGFGLEPGVNPDINNVFVNLNLESAG